MNVTMPTCDQVVVLSYGEKIAEGTPTEIVQVPAILKSTWEPRMLKVERSSSLLREIPAWQMFGFLVTMEYTKIKKALALHSVQNRPSSLVKHSDEGTVSKTFHPLEISDAGRQESSRP